MKTRKQEWYTDEGKQQQLAKLLDHPILTEAMAVLEEDNLPEDDGRELASAETLTNAAMSFKKLSGFFDYRRQLKDLCSPQAKGPQGAPKAYDDDYVRTYAKQHGHSISDTTDQPT